MAASMGLPSMSWSGESVEPVYSQAATGRDPLISSQAIGIQRALEVLLLRSRSKLKTIQIPMPQTAVASNLGIRCSQPGIELRVSESMFSPQSPAREFARLPVSSITQHMQ